MLIYVFKKSFPTEIPLWKWLFIPTSRSSTNLAHESFLRQKSPCFKRPGIGWSLLQGAWRKCPTVLSFRCPPLSSGMAASHQRTARAARCPSLAERDPCLALAPLACRDEAGSHAEMNCSREVRVAKHCSLYPVVLQGLDPASNRWKSLEGKPTSGEPWKDTLIASYGRPRALRSNWHSVHFLTTDAVR